MGQSNIRQPCWAQQLFVSAGTDASEAGAARTYNDYETTFLFDRTES